MATKTFKVALSLDNPRLIQSGIDVRSFDRNSVKISISLTKDSQAYKIPTGAKIKISLFKVNRQEQKIIADVPNTSVDSIDWIVPDYLDGYQGTVRCGVYLISGNESVDLGYFTLNSSVSDIDLMADEFTDNVLQGWEVIEAELQELNLNIAQTKLDLAADMAQVDSTIANINAKNTQVNTLASDFTADVATKQSDVTSKFNAFDASVTQAGQTIDDILGLKDDVQQIGVELNKKANKTQEDWITPPLINGWTTVIGEDPVRYRVDEFGLLEFSGTMTGGVENTTAFNVDSKSRPTRTRYSLVVSTLSFGVIYVQFDGDVLVRIKGSGQSRVSLDGVRVVR